MSTLKKIDGERRSPIRTATLLLGFVFCILPLLGTTCGSAPYPMGSAFVSKKNVSSTTVDYTIHANPNRNLKDARCLAVNGVARALLGPGHVVRVVYVGSSTQVRYVIVYFGWDMRKVLGPIYGRNFALLGPAACPSPVVYLHGLN